MSVIFLTDIFVQCSSTALDHNLPNDSCLFLQVYSEDKITKIGPLVRTSESSWKADRNVEVPTSVPSCKILVLLKHPGKLEEDTQLGFTEFITDHLLSLCMAQIGEVVQAIGDTGNGPPLELRSSCVLIPAEDPPPITTFADDQIRQAILGTGETHSEAILTDFPDIAYEKSLLLHDDDPEKPEILVGVAHLFKVRYAQVQNDMDLDKAITVFNDAVALTPDGHPDQGARLLHLAGLLLWRCQHHPSSSDFDRAIFAFESSIMITGEHNAGPLNVIGDRYLSRFMHTRDVADIDKAIVAYDSVVRLAPEDHPDKARGLHSLGISLQNRFESTGELVDIDRAISVQNDAIRLAPTGDDEKPGWLSNLGYWISCRFERTGEPADIDMAISAHNEAACLTPEGHAEKPRRLNNLAIALMDRFERRGEFVDIDRAISAQNDAVRLTPVGDDEKPGWLSNLGCSILYRFERTGKPADIDRAISAHNEAVRLTPEGHVEKPRRLCNLGNSLLRHFEYTAELVDIDKAISAHRDAVCLLPEGHKDMPSCLSSLGASLMVRFELTAELADIDQAISAHIDAVRLVPEGHPANFGTLSNLGNALARRFDRVGELSDIERAIAAHKDALRLIPDGHTAKPRCLSNLGSSFAARFNHTGDLSDIDNAISTHNDAVRLIPEGHPEKPGWLSNLGISLSRRFRRSGEFIDIDKAISAHNDAIRLTPDVHSQKSMRLSNLGNSLKRRFERSEELVDIDKAISAYNEAVDLTPEGHSLKPSLLDNSGNSLMYRFEITRNRADLDMAISQFRLSARSSTGPPSIRLNAALKWARLALEDGDLTSLQGYEIALILLPRIAWLGQTISTRHKELVSIGGIANEAAAAAIKFGKNETALEWLEQGRSVVWGQLLNLRSPVDELHDADPKLADDIVHISKALERASTRDDSPMLSDQRLSTEEAAQHHRQLAKDWDTLVEKARTITGFEDFLQPKKFAKLTKAARSGPVIVINVDKSRCDALIVMADLDEVIHVPLDGISYNQVQGMQYSLNILLSSAGVRIRDTRQARMTSTMPDNFGFEGILSRLWTHIAKPVLDTLAFSVSDITDPPRIWWCATGPLTFLPIHAAGLYNTHDAGSKLSDFVASSYTPTLTALLEPPFTMQQPFQGLLGVSQPCTPGLSRLPNAEKELAQIEQLDSSLHVHSLLGELATTESVLKGMEQHSWIHLACHAVQDTSEPTQSAFCLQNGMLTLSKIITKSFPHADFAFLSACQTATGDEKLSEEAVHLAAGMLAAGYKSVIATMWSIMDDDAPLVAAEVYFHLVCGPQPDSTRAAHALHHAVRHLREKLEESGKPSFLSWVPFIHVGM
ncbi:hypothetical protein PILCRDRAFT_815805 [Piloderma croceum F 1598]|uniref:CHAT domain-containing protein n=1 Tax=Piloderma croceum (strain F 1598) TaxID=765440 RepID=A0A0C3CA41_PILCF|nr:hypothetical protein PILCRDRAFT_815805 [Piloderma croceum F 1598]